MNKENNDNDSFADFSMPREEMISSSDDQDSFPVFKKNLGQIFDCEQGDNTKQQDKKKRNQKILSFHHEEESNDDALSDIANKENNNDDSPSPSIIPTNTASKIRVFERNHYNFNQNSNLDCYNNIKNGCSNNTNDGGIIVHLRVRPMSSSDIDSRSASNKSTIEIMKPNHNTKTITKIRTHAPETSNAYKVSRNFDTILKEYEFTQVFDDTCTQRDIYQHTIQPLVSGVVNDNQSALIFCYGITNSGKTYTVLGPEKEVLYYNNDKENSNMMMNMMLPTCWGLVPRALHELFTYCQSNITSGATLQLSYFEIYNEQIIDLLIDNGNNSNSTINNNNNNNNMIHADYSTGIRCLQRKNVTKLSDGIEYISLAHKNRRSCTNNINIDSSRSHAICQFHIIQQQEYQQNDRTSSSILESDLWIVDLAGSERSKRTGGTRRQEAADINKSLLTLNRCLTALRLQKNNTNSNHQNNNNVVIPYRDSKLTQIFGHHFTSKYSYRTTMIVNVNPSVVDFDETQQVLSYAAAAKNIQFNNNIIINKENYYDKNHMEIEYDLDGRRKVSISNKQKFILRERTNNMIKKTPMKVVTTSKKKKNKATLLLVKRKRKSIAVDGRGEGIISDTNNNSCSISRKNDITGKMKNTEDAIETEVHHEVNKVSECIIEQGEKMIHDLKLQQQQRYCPSHCPSSSNDFNTTSSTEVLQNRVNELQGQVQECKDEMKRVQDYHIIQMKRIIELHQIEMATLNKTYANKIHNFEEVIKTLNENTVAINPSVELQESNDKLSHAETQIAVLQQEKIEMLLQSNRNNINNQTNSKICNSNKKMSSSFSIEYEENYEEEEERKPTVPLEVVIQNGKEKIEDDFWPHDLRSLAVVKSVLQMKEDEELPQQETKIETKDVKLKMEGKEDITSDSLIESSAYSGQNMKLRSRVLRQSTIKESLYKTSISKTIKPFPKKEKDFDEEYVSESDSIFIATTSIHKSNKNKEQRKKFTRHFWSDEEVAALREGIENHGFGNWAKIKKADPRLHRPSNIQIKDKYRHMFRNNEI